MGGSRKFSSGSCQPLAQVYSPHASNLAWAVRGYHQLVNVMWLYLTLAANQSTYLDVCHERLFGLTASLCSGGAGFLGKMPRANFQLQRKPCVHRESEIIFLPLQKVCKVNVDPRGLTNCMVSRISCINSTKEAQKQVKQLKGNFFKECWQYF